MFSPPKKSSISLIKVLLNKSDWNNIPKDSSVAQRNVTDPNKSAKLLIKKTAHFFQAEGSLFTTQIMKKIIDIDRCVTGVDEILSGNFSNPKNILTPLQLKYFHILQQKNKINPKG